MLPAVRSPIIFRDNTCVEKVGVETFVMLQIFIFTVLYQIPLVWSELGFWNIILKYNFHFKLNKNMSNKTGKWPWNNLEITTEKRMSYSCAKIRNGEDKKSKITRIMKKKRRRNFGHNKKDFISWSYKDYLGRDSPLKKLRGNIRA